MISGLYISADDLTKHGKSLSEVRDDLTIPNPEYRNAKRFGKRGYTPKVPQYLCYLKRVDGGYELPRYYFGEPHLDSSSVCDGISLDGECSITLRDYQAEFFATHEKAIKENSGVLIEAPCGHGKTQMGVYLAFQRGVKTMILVPTYYLAQQWEERIKSCSTSSVVVVKSSDKTISTDKDFTIIVLDLFNCRVLPSELIENVGHVILDEAHRIGAETYMPILDEVPARYRTSLTATFRREDGMHKILAYHFGVRLKMENKFPRPKAYALTTKVRVDNLMPIEGISSPFLGFLDENGISYHLGTKSVCMGLKSGNTRTLKKTLKEWYEKGRFSTKEYRKYMCDLSNCQSFTYTTMETFLNDHSGRRKQIIALIQKALDAGRTVLFLSKRKDALKSLYNYFKEYKPALIISETNKRSKEENDYIQNECRLILGVNQLAKEGLDVARLDTLIIHLPMKDTEQAIGRISRLHDGKKPPIAFYLLDDIAYTYATFKTAKEFMMINADYAGEIRLSEVDDIL